MVKRWLLSCCVVAFGVTLLAPSAGLTQISFGVGGENVEAESSMMPFKIQMRGVLNAPPKDNTLGVVTLLISTYHETYDFDVATATALDDARITSWSILQKYKDGKQNIKLVGPDALLSKVGQAPPGTPMTITGFLRQRPGTLQLIKVETMTQGEDAGTPEDQSAVEDQSSGGEQSATR
ncbi:MAG: hypothetical protein AB7G75_35465 [Candidatus Binatia bacterium]